ncbi:MAG: MarR family transcriptional regulator [Coprobacillus sp.]
MNRDELIKGMEDKRILFGLFFAFSNRLQVAGDHFYEEITCKQFFLLICLSLFQEYPPTINELSDIMGSSHQNVKQIVNKLVEKEFLEISPDNQDKRKLRIVMTDKMNQFQHKYENQEIDFMDQLYNGVSKEEVLTTIQTLQKLENNLIKMEEI